MAIHRRDLFRGALAATAASQSRVLGANDRIHLGLIGAGGRGTGVMGTFQKNPAIQVSAVRDVAPPALQTKPSNLDWARYLGPVKWRDYDPQQYWNFRAYLEFGGGQVTDLFTHWIDVAHMLIGEEIPCSGVAAGGVYHYKDGRTAPDTICVLLEYPGEWTATFEATLAPGLTGAGVEICGSAGRLWISRGRYEHYTADSKAPPVVVKSDGDQTIHHVNNFIDCCRSRKLPNGDVLIGHRSAQASHLGNIAWVQKRRLKFDPLREEILPL